MERSLGCDGVTVRGGRTEIEAALENSPHGAKSWRFDAFLE